jgi:hypothetical protein
MAAVLTLSGASLFQIRPLVRAYDVLGECGIRIVRYFNALFAATPTYTSIAADHDVMQKMLEKFKASVESDLPKK